MTTTKAPEIGQEPRQETNDTWVKSYRYLRIAIVVLLFGLGAAVLYQTWQQGWHVLASISAYYYTPAGPIIVSTLIGLGICMIALKGTNPVEDVFLNIGGMFAAVVAVVPTSRGPDYRTAVDACNAANDQVLGVDCPNVRALQQATEEFVENSVAALLVMGTLGLVLATTLYPARDGDPRARPWNIVGFLLAAVVWLGGLVGLVWATDWFIDNAHYVAALGLLGCVFVVALANVWRRRKAPEPATNTAIDPYAWLALTMVVVAVASIPLAWTNNITAFWPEVVIAGLFAALWLVQSIELDRHPSWP